MSKNSPSSLNTPGRRLGLQRRRFSPLTANNSPLPYNPNSPVSGKMKAFASPLRKTIEFNLSKESKLSSSPSTISNSDESLPEDDAGRQTYLESLENRLAVANDVGELEASKDMWRNACFQAFKDLQDCITNKQQISVSSRKLAEELGIFSVLRTHAGDGVDVEFSESDEEAIG